MTYPLINNAKDIVFMITGGQKSEILHSLIKKIDNQYPASRILPVGTMTFLCDRESAVNLSD
jgi:6-phosphogluconolactonase